MKEKYRILQRGNRFYPQWRFWFLPIWYYFYEYEYVRCYTKSLAEAQLFLDRETALRQPVVRAVYDYTPKQAYPPPTPPA
jgi:hypothetical protein